LSPLRSFETTLESYNNTIIIDDISNSKTLTASLLTLKETLDFKQPLIIISLNQLAKSLLKASSPLTATTSQLNSSIVKISSTLSPKSITLSDSSSSRDSPRD
jgi:hypothetical protein